MNGSSPKSVAEQNRNDVAATGIRVNTLLCTNALFLQHAAVCLASLLANNPELFFNVVIVAQPTEIDRRGKAPPLTDAVSKSFADFP